MIESFRHKGLKRFYEQDDARGLNPQHAEKISLILTTLFRFENGAATDLDLVDYH